MQLTETAAKYGNASIFEVRKADAFAVIDFINYLIEKNDTPAKKETNQPAGGSIRKNGELFRDSRGRLCKWVDSSTASNGWF